MTRIDTISNRMNAGAQAAWGVQLANSRRFSYPCIAFILSMVVLFLALCCLYRCA